MKSQRPGCVERTHERVQLVDRLVTDEMREASAVRGPARLVDQQRHAAKLAVTQVHCGFGRKDLERERFLEIQMHVGFVVVHVTHHRVLPERELEVTTA